MENLYSLERETRVSCRLVGGKPEDGILTCGFMYKPTVQHSQIDFCPPYYSCLVLLEGSGEYWDEMGVHEMLGPGSVVQRMPNRIHSTRVDGDGKWLEYFVGFGQRVFDTLTALGLLNGESPVGYFPEPEKQIPVFQELLSQMSTTPDGFLMPSLQKAQQIAVNLTSQMKSQAKISPMVAQACEMLKQDIKKELVLTELAKELSVGYETFRKLFQQEMKMSPDHYRQQKRMTTAQLMLMERTSVKSVAKALGYSDAYAFSKQFKHYFGCAPAFYIETFGK